MIDDGYGKKETAIGFEQVVGSKFGDILSGDRNDNTLKGQDGNDQMTGRGGADHFVFNNAPAARPTTTLSPTSTSHRVTRLPSATVRSPL